MLTGGSRRNLERVLNRNLLNGFIQYVDFCRFLEKGNKINKKN